MHVFSVEVEGMLQNNWLESGCNLQKSWLKTGIVKKKIVGKWNFSQFFPIFSPIFLLPTNFSEL